MGQIGFFTRQDSKDIDLRPKRATDLPVSYLHKMGADGVRSMNPSAKNPNMPPTGAPRPLVYVLGEAPGATEDTQREQFVGLSGQYLRRQIPSWLQDQLRWDNCCRTRPPENRKPTTTEIECFRPGVIKSIEKAKPKAILGVGAVPLDWALPGIGKINVVRGRRFPIKVGTHVCWYYPILHPSYILRVRNQQGSKTQAPGPEIERVFRADIKRMCNEIRDLPDAKVYSTKEEDLIDGIEILWKQPNVVSLIEKRLAAWEEADLVTIDLETSCLRPYSKDARVLSIAVGNHKRVTVFPLDSKQHTWAPEDRQRILDAFWKLLKSKGSKQAHNLAFELEWFVHLFGKKASIAAGWEDTQAGAYVLDERKGALSLDFICRQHLGVALKSLSNVNPKKPESAALSDLLRYNALDVKYCALVGIHQRRERKKEKLVSIYREHVDRIPSFVVAQNIGMPVDQDEVQAFQSKFERVIERSKERIMNLPEISRYTDKFGSFNPASNKDLGYVFDKILERREVRRGDKISVDEETLKSMPKVPLARFILKMRHAAKLKSTYVDILDIRKRDTIVYPDGRLHPFYKTMFTSTGRTSGEDPNPQNFPKRKDAQLRKQIHPPPGWLMLACDYGQLEAGVIGMASKDKALCHALWNDIDIHMDWSERIRARYDKTFKKRGSNVKEFRNDTKGEFVFPAFYGAKSSHISRMMEMPDEIGSKVLDEFWEEFKGVRRWQLDLRVFYEDNLYVECLTGRRRHAPMTDNQIINSPIQGSASDIVVNAMNRLHRLALTTKRIWLHPVLNVHDDLTFFIPKSELEEAKKIILKEMLTISYDWINVPLKVEMSVGPNWFELEEVGKFKSNN